ncbi:MAG: carbohydrate ABC transporter permease [Thermomicrobiales bacterium]
MVSIAPRLGSSFTEVGRSLRQPRILITVMVLTAISIVWIYPFLWMLGASVKKPLEIFAGGLGILPAQWQWHNYGRAWTDAHFGRYLLNTVIVTGGATLLTLTQCALTGYVLGRYSFIGKRVIIGVLLATLFIPAGYTIIPLVEMAERLGMLNSLWGMIVILGGPGHTAAILLFAGYFSQIPKELEEAAILDGAGFFQVFWRIMLPLAKPVMATVTILTFLGVWNNFFVPLVFTFSRPELRTLSVGMLAFVGQHETDRSGMAAGATISLVPVMIVFLLLQRYYIEGIAGAVKS